MNRIARWSGFLLVMVLVHDLDHVRQGRAVDAELFGVGAFGLAGAIIVFVLTRRGAAVAVPLAAAVGLVNVIGLPLVHLLPKWGPISDPYPAANVDALSYAVVAVMMAVAAVLAVIALVQMRNRRVVA